MKKYIVFCLVFVIAYTTVFTAFSAGGITKEIFYNGIKVVIDGKQATFDENSQPFVMDGTTYLPLRAMGNALGKEVSYDAGSNTAYLTSPGGSSDNKPVDSAWTALTAENISTITYKFTRDADLLRHGTGSFSNGAYAYSVDLTSVFSYLYLNDLEKYSTMKASVYVKNIGGTAVFTNRNTGEVYKSVAVPANEVVTIEFSTYGAPKLEVLIKGDRKADAVIIGDVFFK